VILCAGLSPAWQHTLVFEDLRLGEVNRAREVHWCASGKVINAARAVHRLAAHSGGGPLGRALTVLGGPTGELARSGLAAEGMDVRVVPIAAATRVCTTVIGRTDGSITELVENAGLIDAAELEAFRVLFRAEARGAGALVLMGSLPEGAPSGYYRDLLEGLSAPAVIDARGPELLEALPLRPLLVKPNREELSRTVGRPIVTEDDLRAAMRELERRGARWILVSQGRSTVWVLGEGRFHRFRPPLVKSLNPIGSGDCLAGAAAWAIARGDGILDAISTGIAAAADNAASLLPGHIDAAGVERRRHKVLLEEA